MHIIGGKFKKRALVTPKTDKVRPTTSQLREALFNICQFNVEDSRFLDLFAGSGAMGLEALSRGAAQVTFIENNRSALAAIKENIASLHVEKESTLLGLDALKALQRLYDQGLLFDLIYIDPPYGKGLSAPTLQFIDSHKLLAPGGSLFIEDSSLHIPPLVYLTLKGERRVGHAHLYEFHL